MIMKKKLYLLSGTALLVAITFMRCVQIKDDAPVEELPSAISQDSLIKRGGYLVSAAACDDCHSPKLANGFEFDPGKRFSGHPSGQPMAIPDVSALKDGYILFGPGLTSAIGPWGMSFSANITSDATGIGNWTEDQFFTAIRKGKSKGIALNRDLLPPMPWPIYKNFSDDDLRAIFAFLKSTRPVRNIVPGPRTLDELRK